MGLPIIGDIFSAVSGVFSGIAGWAIDSVIAAITSWVLSGVLALIEAVWSVIDTSTSPTPVAGWFSGPGSSPFEMALGDRRRDAAADLDGGGDPRRARRLTGRDRQGRRP